jgi:hypothetical protein
MVAHAPNRSRNYLLGPRGNRRSPALGALLAAAVSASSSSASWQAMFRELGQQHQREKLRVLREGRLGPALASLASLLASPNYSNKQRRASEAVKLLLDAFGESCPCARRSSKLLPYLQETACNASEAAPE